MLSPVVNVAVGLQHRPPAQLSGLPPPGSGNAPPLSALFGCTCVSGQERAIGRAKLVIEAGSISGGRSWPALQTKERNVEASRLDVPPVSCSSIRGEAIARVV